MQPVWNALNGAAGRDVEWSNKEKASLRSALAGRQWPQLRCWQADFAEHDRCLLRVHEDFTANVDCVNSGYGDMVDDEGQFTAAYTHDNIMSAPIGSIQHRVCDCPAIKQHRDRLGPSLMGSLQPGAMPRPLQDAFSTGLFPLPRLQVAVKRPPMGSCQWVYNEDKFDFVKRSDIF